LLATAHRKDVGNLFLIGEGRMAAIAFGVSASTLLIPSQTGKFTLPVWLLLRTNHESYAAKVD
jgi:hypothetical protein